MALFFNFHAKKLRAHHQFPLIISQDAAAPYLLRFCDPYKVNPLSKEKAWIQVGVFSDIRFSVQ
jgi:hypothetical protein